MANPATPAGTKPGTPSNAPSNAPSTSNGEAKVKAKRAPLRPIQRGTRLVPADAIPPAQRNNRWNAEIEFLRANPGLYADYNGVPASSVSYLRKQGIDARGQNTRWVDENGNRVPEGTEGAQKVLDMWAGFDPEKEQEILLSRKGSKAHKAAPSTSTTPAGQAPAKS